eukprot:gene46439-40552_t
MSSMKETTGLMLRYLLDMRGTDVGLKIDGGTLSKRRMLSSSVSFRRRQRFWKSHRVGFDCKQKRLTVTAYSWANGGDAAAASGFEPSFYEGEAGELPVILQEDEWDEALRELTVPTRFGLFRIPCHMCERVTVCLTADVLLERMVETYCDHLENMMLLQEMQKEAGIPEDRCLTVERYCKTRWNSKVSCLIRLLQLEGVFSDEAIERMVEFGLLDGAEHGVALRDDFLCQMSKKMGGTPHAADFLWSRKCDQSIMDSVTVLFPLAQSSRIMEQRNSNLVTAIAEFGKWRQHVRDMRKLGKRFEKAADEAQAEYFDVDIYHVYEILRTDVDQRKMDSKERTDKINKSLLFLSSYCGRHGFNFDEPTLRSQAMEHILMEDRKPYFEHWSDMSSRMMEWALFAKALGEDVLDEAEVERNFKREKIRQRRHERSLQRAQKFFDILSRYESYLAKHAAKKGASPPICAVPTCGDCGGVLSAIKVEGGYSCDECDKSVQKGRAMWCCDGEECEYALCKACYRQQAQELSKTCCATAKAAAPKKAAKAPAPALAAPPAKKPKGKVLKHPADPAAPAGFPPRPAIGHGPVYV